MTEYKPGDIANGHRLTETGEWVPVGSPPPPPPPPPPGAPSQTRAESKASAASAKASRPWYKKKRFIIPLALLALIIITGAMSGTDTEGQLDDVPSASDSDRGNDSGGDSDAERATREAEKAALDKSTYKEISDQEFKLLFKDPDAHKGEKYVIYGWVFQFDAATGTEEFLADVSRVRLASAWDYTERAWVTLDDAKSAADVVQGDLVTLYAEVEGSYSYDTQEGGSTVVPSLRAHIVEKTGHTEE